MKIFKRKITKVWFVFCMMLVLSATGFQAASWLDVTAEPTETAVTLKWKNKNANAYKVYRANTLRDGSTGAFTFLAQLSGKKETYVDRSAATGGSYTYKVERIRHKNGNLKVAARGTAEAVMQFSRPYWEEDFFSDGFYSPGCIELEFCQQDGFCPNGYEIYRKEAGKGYQRIAVINKKLRCVKYQDKKVVPGKSYEYRVRSFRKKNGKKQFSKYSSIMRRYSFVKPLETVFQVQTTLMKDKIVIALHSQPGNGFVTFRKNDTFEIMSWDAEDNMLDNEVLCLKQYSTDGVKYQDATRQGAELKAGETIYLLFAFDEKGHQVPDISKGYKVDGQIECGYLNFSEAELFIDMKTNKVSCSLNMEAYH